MPNPAPSSVLFDKTFDNKWLLYILDKVLEQFHPGPLGPRSWRTVLLSFPWLFVWLRERSRAPGPSSFLWLLQFEKTQGLLVALGHALTLLICHAQEAVRGDISLVGFQSIPHRGLLVVLDHGLALFVHEAQVILRLGISLVGSDFPTPNYLAIMRVGRPSACSNKNGRYT